MLATFSKSMVNLCFIFFQREGREVRQEKNGSLEIGVTKNLSHTDWTDFTEEHGFF